MTRSLVIEFSPGAVERIERLVGAFGDRKPEEVIMRGLGLLEAVKPYLLDGQVTVIDYTAEEDAQYVDLVFDNAQPETSGSRLGKPNDAERTQV